MQCWKIVLIVIMISMCCGCSNRELEERGFPLTIAIDKSERGMTVSFELPDLSKSAGEKNPIAKPMSFSVEAGAYYEAQKAYEKDLIKQGIDPQIAKVMASVNVAYGIVKPVVNFN